MQISVTGRHIDVTAPMEEYATKKCERLPRYFDRVQQVDVLIDKPNREFEVEVITHVDRHDPFIAREQGADFYACLDSVIDKVTRQLTEHKNKVRNRKHPSKF